MTRARAYIARITVTTVALLAVAACGGSQDPPSSPGGTATGNAGSGGTGGSPTPTSTVGGTISGLVGQGLTLELLNLANTAHHTTVLGTLPISHDGKFVFGPKPYDLYGVTVKTQPNSPTQRCVVSNAQGEIGASPVTDVFVRCGAFSHVTNAGDGTISTFSVDAVTGALTPVGAPMIAGSSPYAMASSIDKKYLYVGNSSSNDISVFAVDPKSGTLSIVPGSPIAAGQRPRALALFAMAGNGYGPPLVRTFLYAANAGSNNLSAYSAGDVSAWVPRGTGLPIPLSPASYATGTGPSVIVIDPSRPFLFTANTGGSNDISAFLVDGSTGALTPIAGSPYPSGSRVSSLAFGAGGKFLYAANAAGDAAAIHGFSVDAEAGTLTTLADFPFALPACRSIIADQTGGYLYATTAATVLAYRVDPLTGALSPLPGSPVAVSPDATALSIDPANQFLYVGDAVAETVAGFRLNASTGELSALPLPGSPFPVNGPADLIATY